MTPQRPKDFSDRLVRQQSVDEALRLRYRQQLEGSFERPMTHSEKNHVAFAAIACVGFIVFFTYTAVARIDFSVTKRSISIAMIFLSAFFAWHKFSQFKRGIIDPRAMLRKRRWVQIGLMLAAVFIVARLSIQSATMPHTLIVLISLTLLGVLLAGIRMRMMFTVLQSKMEEQNLELQYRMAELAEQMQEVLSVNRRSDEQTE